MYMGGFKFKENIFWENTKRKMKLNKIYQYEWVYTQKWLYMSRFETKIGYMSYWEYKTSAQHAYPYIYRVYY